MRTIFGILLITFNSLALACPKCSETDTSVKSAKQMLKESTTPSTDNPSSVDLSEYNAIFEKVRKIYTPIFSKAGFQLLLESDWNDSTEQAFSVDKKIIPTEERFT